MDTILRLKAHAKINLSLDVLSKREDGYHNVRMIMQTLKLADTLTMERIAADQVTLSVNVPGLPVDDRNLVVRAVKRLKEQFGISQGVRMELEKTIPIEAGMAGGSTDAAAALQGMNRLFGLKLSQEDLVRHGAALGADVPFCLIGGTALSEGIGERLTPLPPMPGCWVLIAKPPLSVSTRYVYEHLDLSALTSRPNTDAMAEALRTHDLDQIALLLENVLESVTIKKYPLIADIKRELCNAGAMNALMSGSGSAVFGLFEQRSRMVEAGRRLSSSLPSLQILYTAVWEEKAKRQKNI